MARDLKAYCQFNGIEYKWSAPGTDHFEVVPSDKKFSVAVESEDKAPKYMGVNITNLTVKPSPLGYKTASKLSGLVQKTI